MSTFSTLSPPHKKRRCRTLCSALARAKNSVAQIHCRKVVAFCSATCYNMPCPWGYSSVGRALEWHSRGQGFDSPYLHQRFELRLKAIQRTGSSAQMPLPFSLARTLPRSPLRSDNASLRSSLRLPPLIWFHHLPKDPIVRVFFLSSRADGGDNESAPQMTRFSRQSGCTRLRLDTFVSRHSLTAIAVRRPPYISDSSRRSRGSILKHLAVPYRQSLFRSRFARSYGSRQSK